ncbi:hypothetical protein Tco_1498570, partial [Tanacetum coccineum]
SSVKDKILATSSETSKVENAPAEMLRDMDQQMEKRADDDTDIAKISRKRSKPDNHGHRNGKENTRAGRMLTKVNKSQLMVNNGQPQKDKTQIS